MLNWVRSVNASYGHLFGAKYMRYAGSAAPDCDEIWVYDTVLRAVQTLFFEAMKRWLSNGGDRQKMRLLYVGFTEYESLSNNPMRVMSDEAEELIHLEGEALLAKDAPNLSHLERVPWLLNELYSVTEVGASEIRHAVKRKHWEAWSEQHPEPASTGRPGVSLARVLPSSP